MVRPSYEKSQFLCFVDRCKARVLCWALPAPRFVSLQTYATLLPSNVMLERTFTNNHSNNLASIDWRAKAGLGAIGGTIVILSLLASPFLLVPASKKLGSLPWMVALR
jgi:hypothetical protein